MEEKLSEFCPCKDRACPLHPSNHNKGCSLCMMKNIKQKEVPSCLFDAAKGYPSENGYSFEAFAELVLAKKTDGSCCGSCQQ